MGRAAGAPRGDSFDGAGDVSHILQLLGRGVDRDLSDWLDHFFRPARGAAPAGAVLEGPNDTADRPMQQGLAHLRAGRLDDAIEHLCEACRADHCLPALAAMAAALDEKGDPAGALQHLEAIDRIRPDDPTVLFAIGFCREKLFHPGQAVEAYRRAVEIDEALLPARERLAALAVLIGDLDVAIEQYQVLRDLEPQRMDYRSALAHLYLGAGLHAEAIDEFETAIAMEPDNWALVDDEVEALVSQDRIREAMDRLHWLISHQGPFADLHVRLADLCSRVHDDDGAVRNYLLALDLQPGYLEATVRLGTHHLVHRRWEEAAEAFHRAAELNDRLLSCYVGMGVSQSALGQTDDAANSLDLAGAVEPNSILLMSEVAKLQLRSLSAEAPGAPCLDTASEALLDRQIERHAQEVRRHPLHADLHYRYGVLLRARGQVRSAAEEFAGAVRLSPSFMKAWIKLGVVRQEIGQPDEAIHSFCQAVAIEPASVERHYRLAVLYTHRASFQGEVQRREAAADPAEKDRVRADLALSLQNMALMDRVSATWRSLRNLHRARAG